MRASSMSWSLMDSELFSSTGGVDAVGDQRDPPLVETSTTTGHDGADPAGLTGQVPTTAHTPDSMALTSDTTGPMGACDQLRPPSELTHRGTDPDDVGAPPQR